MRHGYFGHNLSRPIGKRNELFKSLLNEVIRVGKIETTRTKAKAVQGAFDKLVTMAKKQTVAARSNLEKTLIPDMAKKIFKEVKDKVYDGRNSGYSRIVRLGKRYSDDSEMVILELIKAQTPAVAVEVPPTPEATDGKVAPKVVKKTRKTKKDE